MNKNKSKFEANLIEIMHIIITVVYITCMVLIIGYEKYKIYAAVFLASVWIIEVIFGYCPLTVEENYLRRKTGEKVKIKRFIPRFFNKYLGIDISGWLAELVLGIFFVLSVFIIVQRIFPSIRT